MTAGADLVCELAGDGMAVDVADGRLVVRPASALRPVHRTALREHLGDVLDALAQPDAWRTLARAYFTHHSSCVTCQAAGRGAQYGRRCAVGQLLNVTYEHAFDRAHPPEATPVTAGPMAVSAAAQSLPT